MKRTWRVPDTTPDGRTVREYVAGKRQNTAEQDKEGVNPQDVTRMLKNGTVGLAMTAKSKVSSGAQKVYQGWASSQAPLERMNKVQEKPTIDAATQIVRQSGGTVDYIMSKKLVDADGNELGLSYKDLMAKIPRGDLVAFNDYAQNKHNIDRMKENVKKPVNGMSAEASRKIVARYENENPEFKQISKEITQWWDTFTREWLVKNGLLSEADYTTMRGKYPNYIPVLRAEHQGAGGVNHGKTVSTPNMIKQAEGGISEIVPLEEAFAQKLNQGIRAVRRNELYTQLLNFVQESPKTSAEYGIAIGKKGAEALAGDIDFDEYMNTVDREIFKKLDNGGWQVKLFKDGKPVVLEVSEDVSKSLRILQGEGIELAPITAAVKNISSKSKSAITGINALFAVTNTIRDMQTYLTNTISNNPLQYTSNYFKAIYDIVTNSEMYNQYLAMGNSRSGFYGSQKGFKDSVQRNAPFKEQTARQKAGTIANAPWAAFGAIGAFTEKIPRIAEYRNALAMFGDTPEGRRAASFAAADVTTNFSRSGYEAKFYDAFVMYLNAQIQGLDKTARQLKNRPIATLSKAAVVVTIPSLILLLINAANPHYDDLDDRTKDSYFIIPNMGGELDAQGRAKTFIRLPRSREYGALLGASLDRVARYMETGDAKKEFKGYWKTIAKDILPSNPLTENYLAPLFINLPSNKDFAGRSIVPENMLDLEPQYQYDINTSGVAKEAGALLKQSPKQIDYLINSYAGYPGQLLQAATSPQNKGENLSQTVSNTLARTITQPFERRFTADPRYQNGKTDALYNELDAARIAAKTKNFANDILADYVTPEEKYVSALSSYTSELSELRKKEKAILAQAISGEEKQKSTNKIREEMLEIARVAIPNAQKTRDEYAKNYVEEISGLSEKQQETARALWQNYSVDYDDYLAFIQETKNMTADKDANGNSISGSKKRKVYDYLRELSMDSSKKRQLFESAGYVCDDSFYFR